MPSFVRVGEFHLIATLGRGNEIDGDEDMLLQQVRELRASSVPVIGNDRVADILLIPEQALRRCIGTPEAPCRIDDVLPRPNDVIGPELSHSLM